MDSKIDIRRISILEIKFLLRLLNSPHHRGLAESPKEAGFIVHLQRKGIIIPSGKISGKIRWELHVKFTIEEINLMKSLAED